MTDFSDSELIVGAPCGCRINTSTGAVERGANCKEHNKKAVAKAPALIRIMPVSIQEGIARRGLEKRLAFHLNACRAHEKNGIVRGHGAYVLLYNQSLALLDEFGARFLLNVSDEQARATLFAQYPAMYVMKKLATAPPADSKAGIKAGLQKPSISQALIWTILAVLLFGVLSGLYHGAEHQILKLFGG